jgi:predicted HicB family RNase H-like nuclease
VTPVFNPHSVKRKAEQDLQTLKQLSLKDLDIQSAVCTFGSVMKEERKNKERFNFRLDPELMEHVQKKARKRRKNLTQYVEAALRKASDFEEKLI